ncbi:methionine--tRNA ligase, mitochondrial [Plakobranchus ocellatus]|uniref:Methionine--tRNA ligase, mitochondrial n=1 Tax=Plakobranchus ocellatus TaxID=259542 RepID=A0AAV3YUN6_9GAST|nr:methionine--tRNA ligase, mitochondrial [Plakobranchus ocellatus]
MCRLSVSKCIPNEKIMDPDGESADMSLQTPHLGHLYCCLLADASARWQRVKGQPVLFTTGTDEHGLKIQQAAAVSNLSPQQFCDDVSEKFKTLFKSANIEFSAFLRTTDKHHIEAVQAFWNCLQEGGHIYQGTYTGWYSVSDEAFLDEEDVKEKLSPDGSIKMVSIESGHPVTWTEERNYMFKLSNFQQDLFHWLNSQPIHPRVLEPQVRRMIQTLPDLSVTRDSERLTWGIPVPGDSSQMVSSTSSALFLSPLLLCM